MPATKSIIISCAGLGSRLGLGQTKALLNINGKPLIYWQLLAFENIEDVRIVVGYQARDLIDEVLKYRQDVIFINNHQYFETKTGASFYLGARHGNEYSIEWDGDLLVHPDDIETILREDGEFICYADRSSDEAVFVNVNDSGDVVSFSTKKGDFEWTGPASILKSNLVYMKGSVFNQLESILPAKGLRIRAYDIDTYDDYTRVSKLVEVWWNEK